jgi:hypothetical protein
MKRLLALASVLVLTASVFGASPERRTIRPTDFASDFQTVPVMGNVPGVGSTFQTHVSLLNPTSSAFPVVVTLYDATGSPRTATIQLAAGELKTYQNFLGTVYNNYVGGGAVTFRTSDPSQRFIVNTEVWTSGARFGTSVPSLEFAGTNSRSFVPGVTVDGTFRTNIGCFNQAAVPNAIHATVFDKNGSTVGTVDLNMAANGWGQVGVNASVTDGYIQFDPAEAAVCYAVVVTNATNDGHFILATEYKP